MHDQHKDRHAALVNNIARLNEAIEVYTIFGEWDIYVRWLCESNARVMELLRDTILTDQGVEHVETLTLAQEFRRERGPMFGVKSAK
jgi:DNA-binding Lrp family transcriptional regulator